MSVHNTEMVEVKLLELFYTTDEDVLGLPLEIVHGIISNIERLDIPQLRRVPHFSSVIQSLWPTHTPS